MIYLLNGDILNEMADTIRNKNGTSALMTPAEMAEAILTLPLNTNIDDPYKEFLSTEGLAPYINANCDLLKGTDGRRPGDSEIDPEDKDKRAMVRYDITRVGAHAFYCSYPEFNLSFPNATLIGAYAFAESGLKGGVLFPGSLSAAEDLGQYYNVSYWPYVTAMGNHAFYNSKVHRVNMPKLTYIPSYAFYACWDLQTAVFHSSKPVTIQDNAFAFCSDLHFVRCCPEYIGDEAFSHTNMTNISFTYLTHDVQSGKWFTQHGLEFTKHIGEKAFDGCETDGEWYLPSVEYIGTEAFGKYGMNVRLILPGPTIPDVGENIFSVGANENADGWNDNWIYVPDSMVEDYKKGKWSAYARLIKPLSRWEAAQNNG